MNKASIQIIVCDDGEIRFDVVGDKDSESVEIANDILFAAAETGIHDCTFQEG